MHITVSPSQNPRSGLMLPLGSLKQMEEANNSVLLIIRHLVGLQSLHPNPQNPDTLSP